MALIQSIERSDKDRSNVHKPTRCQYTIVDGNDGQRYLQLDTFGSEDRVFEDKISQSIQFNRDSAAKMLELIRTTFIDLE